MTAGGAWGVLEPRMKRCRRAYGALVASTPETINQRTVGTTGLLGWATVNLGVRGHDNADGVARQKSVFGLVGALWVRSEIR